MHRLGCSELDSPSENRSVPGARERLREEVRLWAVMYEDSEPEAAGPKGESMEAPRSVK